MGESKYGEEEDGVEVFESKFMDAGDSDEEGKHGEDNEGKNDDGEEGTLTLPVSIFGDDPIIEHLVDFWGEKLTEDVEGFFTTHCYKFDTEEHKLEFTKLHKKYEKIVEDHLQEFAEQEDITAEEMFERVQACTSQNDLAQLVSHLSLHTCSLTV